MLAKNTEERLEFGISPRQKFESADVLVEDFPLFPCLSERVSAYPKKKRYVDYQLRLERREGSKDFTGMNLLYG